MLENGNNFTTYNNYDGIDEIPYAIIEWLLRNKSDVAENFGNVCTIRQMTH